MKTRLLMVTRETAQDRKYGLGKSISPLLEPLRGAGLDVRYFCQEDLTPATVARRASRASTLRHLPGLSGHPTRQSLVDAWHERLHVGLEAARTAAAGGYTHVHAHDPWLACGVAWGLWRLGARRIRWGFTEHGFGSYSQATHDDGLTQGPRAMALTRRIERWIAARASWVIAPTAASLAQLARDLGVAAPPAHWRSIVHARPPIAPADAAQRQAARESLGWTGDDIAVLAVGRLAPLKCFDRVVRACASQNDARIRLLILGAGDATALNVLVRELGFESRLTIEATQDPAPYYHAADIYMSASSTESFGMANLEALCAGLPSICSAVGGVPEVVGHGAWLLPNDTNSLTLALSALRTDASLRDSWSRRALERTAAWPSAEQVAKDYVAIYQAT